MYNSYDFKLTQNSKENPVHEQLNAFKKKNLEMWWETDSSFNEPAKSYSKHEQMKNEKSTNNYLKRILREFEYIPKEEDEHKFWMKNIKNLNKEFAKDVLEFNDNYLDILFMDGFTKSTIDFLKEAKKFDSEIKVEDVFQAIRNVWIMNSIQLFLGKDIEFSPSIFAYSMLYPYSDNYLDDDRISKQTKISFNYRFRQRLSGEHIKPQNSHELEIFLLINMIEDQYPRDSYPQIYEALLGIHKAQNESLLQQDLEATIYENDILGITFEKGGMSVLTDAYLIKGKLLEKEAEFIFAFGVILQLADDIQDVISDSEKSHMTIFSQILSTSWKLDNITNKLFNFITIVFEDNAFFNSPKLIEFKNLIKYNCNFLILQSIAKNQKFYSKKYIKNIESYSQFSFKFLKNLYKRLERDYKKLNKKCNGFDYTSIFEISNNSINV